MSYTIVDCEMHASIYSFISAAVLATPALGAHIEYIDNGRGPVPLYIPADYDESTALPLVVALHGYSDPAVDGHFDFSAQVDAKRFLYCVPTGTQNTANAPFWNATDACCDFFNSNVDDSGYLRELVELIQSAYAVDAMSIHFTGISNGGFMTHRMACDHADLIASVAALAGTTHLDALDCSPSSPVHVLHIHGTSDSTIHYDGGCIAFDCYPGADETVNRWATYNTCDVIPKVDGSPFNLDWSVPGAETTSTTYEQNCDGGVTVELWRMEGSQHVPLFRRNNDPPTENLFGNQALEWLLAHRKQHNTICPCDTDSNGLVGIEDLMALLGAWGSNESSSDFDLNGTVDVSDLSTLLDAWGPCP